MRVHVSIAPQPRKAKPLLIRAGALIYKRMLRFFSRFLGVWAVAGALAFAVIDGAKSIAASALTITPAADAWTMLGGARGDGAGWPWPLGQALDLLLAAPVAAILAALGFVLLAAGRKRRRAFPGGEYAT